MYWRQIHRNVKESETIYLESHFDKLRPVSSASLILFINHSGSWIPLPWPKLSSTIEGEFVLAHILVISVQHLSTWVILRMSQNNEHSKQLASSKKQPSNFCGICLALVLKLVRARTLQGTFLFSFKSNYTSCISNQWGTYG